MTFRHLRSFICFAMLMYCASPASAALLYSDNFTSGAGWTTNVAPTANASLQEATFNYDYSAMGIPAAPGSSDTVGLRLRANIPGGAAAPVTTRPAGVTSGLSVSPTGGNFGTNYMATFYAWSNFNGSANASGLADNGASEGGTNNVLFALGTSGTVPVVVGNTTLVTNGQMDGIGFATSGDGGITNDYRVYPKSGTIAATTAMNGGSYSNTAAYYQAMPSLAPHTAPPVQLTLSNAEFPDAINTQAGSTQIGAFGFAWHKVQIIKNGNTARWVIDNFPIGAVDISSLGALGGADIALGVSDVNATTTRHPALLFTVFDNLSVESVPEPASCTLVAFGIAAIGLISRRQRGA